MGYHDLYRLSVHGVFLNNAGKILLLKATYGDLNWGLPGGAVDPGETIHQALYRECFEELGLEIKILYLSGIYYHKTYQSHVSIFRCEFLNNKSIQISSEHSAYQYFALDELSKIQQHRIKDCLEFNGTVKSASF